MKRVFNHQGFTLLEAIASVAIITLVFTTAIAIIMAMRNQTIATENTTDCC
jgi:type II secretory pathway pseudopilin PulG